MSETQINLVTNLLAIRRDHLDAAINIEETLITMSRYYNLHVDLDNDIVETLI